MTCSIEDLQQEAALVADRCNGSVVLAAMLAPRQQSYWVDLSREINRSRPPTCAYARLHRRIRRLNKRIDILLEPDRCLYNGHCSVRLIIARLQVAKKVATNNLHELHQACGECFSCLVREFGAPGRRKTSDVIAKLLETRDDVDEFREVFLNLIDGE